MEMNEQDELEQERLRQEKVPPGVYRHFKGKEYEVLGISRDSETLKEKVVYRALYGARGLWRRSPEMFLEEVEVNGKRVPRFQKID